MYGGTKARMAWILRTAGGARARCHPPTTTGDRRAGCRPRRSSTKEAHMIEVLPDFHDSVIGMRCTDHITREDYEAVLIPTLNAAFREHKTMRAYCEIASFSGISPGALWDDIKV